MSDLYDDIAKEMVRTMSALQRTPIGSEEAVKGVQYANGLLELRDKAVQQDIRAERERQPWYQKAIRNQETWKILSKIGVAVLVLNYEKTDVITTRLFGGINRE